MTTTHCRNIPPVQAGGAIVALLAVFSFSCSSSPRSSLNAPIGLDSSLDWDGLQGASQLGHEGIAPARLLNPPPGLQRNRNYYHTQRYINRKGRYLRSTSDDVRNPIQTEPQ